MEKVISPTIESNKAQLKEKLVEAARKFKTFDFDALSDDSLREVVELIATEGKTFGLHSRDLFFLLPQSVKVSKDQANVYSRIYLAIVEIARKRPELVSELGEMENVIGQNPQCMHPCHHLEIAIEAMWDPRIADYLKTGILHGIGYALRFMESDEYETFLTDKINLADPSKFTETRHVLDFLIRVHNVSEMYSYDGDVVVTSRVRQVLSKAIEQPGGNYLLKARARELLLLMKGEAPISTRADAIPFRLTPNRHGVIRNGALFVSSLENEQKLMQIEENIRNAEDEIKSFGSRVWNRSDPLLHLREDLHTQADDLLNKRVGKSDVALSSNEDVTENMLYDHAYLVSSSMRKIIARDFGVDVAVLSIREQFQFLKVLKDVDSAQVETMQTFTRSFGVNGLQTFLVTANRKEILDQVLHLAEHGEKNAIQEIFKTFSSIAKSLDSTEEYLRENFGNTTSNSVNDIVEKQLGRLYLLLENTLSAKDDIDQLRVVAHSVEADCALFVDSCKVLRSIGPLTLESIKGTFLETISGGETILKKDKDTILAFQKERYASKYSHELKEALVASLTSALENPSCRFYIYRKDGKILSYVRFESDTQHLDELHMASFMTNPEYEGGKIGQAMLEVALKKEFEKGLPIHAECDPSLVPFYAKFGFQEVPGGRYDDHGAETCKIVLNPTK